MHTLLNYLRRVFQNKIRGYKMFFKLTLYIGMLLMTTGCSEAKFNDHTIANVPEASGIAYCVNSNTLVVANDEGTFYELSTEGKILSQHTLGKYDLEGVVCHEQEYVFAVENGAVLVVNRETKASNILKVKGKKVKFSKKSGIEGITYHDGLYYLSIQAKDKKDAKIIVLKLGKNYAKIIDIIHHGIVDAAGLEYRDSKIYMVSDKKDKLYVYDLKKGEITKKIKLDKFAQEGIAFDNDKNVYFADDEGSVKKYTSKEVQLKGI